MTLTPSNMMPLGSIAPDFNLPDTISNEHKSLQRYCLMQISFNGLQKRLLISINLTRIFYKGAENITVLLMRPEDSAYIGELHSVTDHS